MSTTSRAPEDGQSEAFLPTHTLIYEWTRNVDTDFKQELMRFFHSPDFLNRSNIFFKGQDPGSGKWTVLMSAAGLQESRQMLLRQFEDRSTSFIILVPNQVPYINIEVVPPMETSVAYQRLNKELNKLNKAEKSRNRVKAWQRELNRATVMVLSSSGAAQLMRDAIWKASSPSYFADSTTTTVADNNNTSKSPSASSNSLSLLDDETTSASSASPSPESAPNRLPSPSTPPASSSPSSPSAKGYWFIAVDIESFEFDHSKVLEIGWSIWDSSRGLFLDKHYAVSDYKHLHNGKFVADRRDLFLFGKTVWAPLEDCIKEIQEDLHRGARFSTDHKCVFIAHDVASDEKYLRHLGVQFPETIVKFDTIELNGAYLGADKKNGLGKVLDEVGIENYSLHNAGNDAHYTLALFLWLVQNNARSISATTTK